MFKNEGYPTHPPQICCKVSHPASKCSQLIIWLTFFLVVALLWHFPAQAEGMPDQKIFTINGFGTLGVARSNTNQADYVRDNMQRKGLGATHPIDFGLDSRIGLQFNLISSDNIDFIVQTLVKRRYDDSYHPEISWAFARINSIEGLQLRLGRLGFDVFLFSDSRDIGYSYVQVRPPPEYYGHLINHVNGADIVYKHPINEHLLSAKLFAGVADEVTPSTLVGGEPVSQKGSPIYGGWLEYQNSHWLTRLGYSQLIGKSEVNELLPYIDILKNPEISGPFPQAGEFADNIGLKDKTINFYSLGLAYDASPLKIQGCVGRIGANTVLFPGIDLLYAGASYRVKKWTPFISYSASRSYRSTRTTGLPDRLNPTYDSLNDAARRIADYIQIHQQTWSIGTRFDFYQNMAFKFQLDKVNAPESYLIRSKNLGWNGRELIWSATFDFIF